MAETFGIACHELVSLDFRCGSKPEVSQGHGNVRSLYEPLEVKVVLSCCASLLSGCSPSAFHVLSPIVVGRSGDVVRGTCDDRINLYPAAPIRLATMLYARTIAGQGWG